MVDKTNDTLSNTTKEERARDLVLTNLVGDPVKDAALWGVSAEDACDVAVQQAKTLRDPRGVRDALVPNPISLYDELCKAAGESTVELFVKMLGLECMVIGVVIERQAISRL